MGDAQSSGDASTESFANHSFWQRTMDSVIPMGGKQEPISVLPV